MTIGPAEHPNDNYEITQTAAIEYYGGRDKMRATGQSIRLGGIIASCGSIMPKPKLGLTLLKNGFYEIAQKCRAFFIESDLCNALIFKKFGKPVFAGQI